MNEEQTEKLLGAVKTYITSEGSCPEAYDSFTTCLIDDCPYCSMVRAYMEIRHGEDIDEMPSL